MADIKDSKVGKVTTVDSGTEMLYQKRHLQIILVGIVVMLLGYAAMSGGSMPDSNTWDDDLIYGFRRTVLAPVLILGGLGIQIYAVFKR
jgi:hypothetical protein